MSYDNTCKYLAERSPQSFVRWLLNIESENVKVIKTELSTEPLHADSITILGLFQQIFHLEFQTLPYSKPPIPIRMLEYKGRLLREYPGHSIMQVVLFLKLIDSELVFQDRYEDENTQHRYQAIRLWEQDAAPLLANPDLLPLAVLAASNNPNALLEQVAQQIAMIEETEKRKEISTCAFILAGLRFPQQLVTQLLREDIMRESVTYQYILQQGMQQGMQRGELAMLRRLLTSRFGTLSLQLEQQMQKLPLSQLEELGAAVFEFNSVADLTAWLQAHEQQ